jgi:hypothetical protein
MMLWLFMSVPCQAHLRLLTLVVNAARLNRANRLASEIAMARKESSSLTGTVTQLQSYLLGNSYIKVFSLDSEYGGPSDEAVRYQRDLYAYL